MYTIDFEKIKREVLITELLDRRSIVPVSRSPKAWLYHSPLREDNHASFIVDVVNNRFRDLARGETGSVIDLAMALGYGITPYTAARALYLEFYGVERQKNDSVIKPESVIRVVSERPLQSEALLQYITVDRCIDAEIAKRLLVEVHYFNENQQKMYFALGMPNRSGGYALRNKYVKNTASPADISILGNPESNSCLVFEGFIDYLSFLCHDLPGDERVVILNSTAHTGEAMSEIRHYPKIICYLDHDDAGRAALAKIRQGCPNSAVKDGSVVYNGHKDYNDFWITICPKC